MEALKNIVDLLALKRSRLENDLGQLSQRRQFVKIQILALKEQREDIGNNLVHHESRKDSINDQLVFQRWCLSQDQKLKTLSLFDEQLRKEMEGVKSRLTTILVQEDMICHRLEAQNNRLESAQMSVESARRMELWVTGNKI